MKTELKPQSNPEFQPDHPLFQPSRFRYLPLSVLLLLIINLLATCHNARTSQLAAKHQPYIYVENADGTTTEAKPVDPLMRSEAVIAKFSEDWLKLAYTWKIAPETGERLVNERGVDFPYQFHKASLAIIPGYREAYMDLTAKKYQQEFVFADYINGQHQCQVRIFEPKNDAKQGSTVQSVEPGVWDVTIVATRDHAINNSIVAHEIFNHVIRVRAIRPSSGDEELWGERDTHLGKLMNEMQKQGLQVIRVSEF